MSTYKSNKSYILRPSKLQMLLEKAKVRKALVATSMKELSEIDKIPEKTSKEEEEHRQATGMHGELITYNAKQQEFIDLVASGQSCILIGAAGCGKTTATQGAIQALIQAGKLPPLDADGHKHLTNGTPGVAIVSYTRRAVNNIRKVQSEELKHSCLTVHKLLEYMPEYFEVYDAETGTNKNTMAFVPGRHKDHLLPTTLVTIVIEEASMLSIDYFEKLEAALDHKVQWIFIGDLNQLPPVFGPAILGFKLLELPTIELTEVYRQALDSPIIRLAHRVILGKVIPASEYTSWHVPGKLTIHPWKKKLSPDNAVRTLGAFFNKGYDTGIYNPDTDAILIPYNKSCGTLELNKHIANHIARTTGAITWEVMAGFSKHYFSIGDYVLYEKEDAIIENIAYNSIYTGASIQPESKYLDYWGTNQEPREGRISASNSGSENTLDVDALLEQIAESEDRVTQASHKITVRLLDAGTTRELTKAADINNLLHSYALTIHKAQGSEWRKVFLCFHQSHSAMTARELLYTAVTRAKEELYIICEEDTFTKGILTQRIKGDTLAEKAEFFKGKSK